jgi:hypothetical protein
MLNIRSGLNRGVPSIDPMSEAVSLEGFLRIGGVSQYRTGLNRGTNFGGGLRGVPQNRPDIRGVPSIILY